MPHKVSKYESLAPCHVLIGEDRDDNLLLIEALTASFGCTTTAARNGSEAIDLCQENSYDVILMDLAMPVKNGLEAAKHIRTNPNANQKTPIIAVTAEVNPIAKSASVSFGIDEYINKPIDAELLYNTIKKALLRSMESGA